MGRRSLEKIFIGLCLVLPLLFVAFTAGEARSSQQEVEQQEVDPPADECESCHNETHDDWAESMHGQATDNRGFLLEWKKQDSPQECLSCHTTGFNPLTGEWEADGITCEVCHGPVPADHPEAIMPIKSSAEDCGSCHVDTHMQWEASGHSHNDLTCKNCHNPHTTEVKAADSQALCRTCHNQESHFYEMTAHAEQGLLCTDCHLRLTDASAGEGHGSRIHTFDVDLRSCTQCHGAEMHYPVRNAMVTHENSEQSGDGEGAVTPSYEPLADSITDAPEAANSTTNYALALTVGLALGIIVAPGLDHLYRRMKRTQ